MLLGLLFSLLIAQQSADSGTVRGQIRNRDGTPAAGIRVALIGVITDTGGIGSDAPLSNISQTDSQGRYRLEGVEPGRYLIIAGSLNAATYYPGVGASENGTRVVVTAGRQIAGADFTIGAEVARIPPRPTVRGLIVVNNGSASSPTVGLPASQARLVRLQLLTPIGQRQLLIDGQFGSFAIDVAGLGEYFLSLSQLPFGYHIKSMTFGKIDLMRDPITTPGADLKNEVQIVLTTTPPPGTPPGVKLSGRTLGEGTGVRLRLTAASVAPRSPPPSGLVRLGTADVTPEGTFEFNNVPPGQWILSSTGAGSRTLTIDVARSDITNLVLDSRPDPPSAIALNTFQGTVAVDGPSPSFEIRFIATRGGTARSVSVSGREFSVQLPELEYRAEISGLPEGFALESVTAGPLDLTAPFLVTRTGFADRFGAIIRGAGIVVRLKAVPPR